MASCCNTITPKMIRTGQMKIGDRIELEDIVASSPDFMQKASTAEKSEPPKETAASTNPPEDVLVHGPEPSMQKNTWTMNPLTYEQMTPYLNHNLVNTQGNQPYVTIPQTPMTPQDFTETIDITDTQNYLGFLRTQIGRYMRIEQLMGSSQVESRYGFLVGIGSNFIILQEITSGNIMVVDLFTIRLTYIYYSDPVVPPGTTQ